MALPAHREVVSLAEFTAPGLLAPDLAAGTAAAVVEELAGRFVKEGAISDPTAFVSAVLEREQKLGTATPSGVAFPHARLASVRRLRFALGRFPTPVRWGGEHLPPVRMVCLVAIPLAEAAAYLKLMATLSWFCRNSAQVEELLDAQDSRAMMAILSRTAPSADTRR
jgi:PTS system fructose-specific IIC component